MSERKLVTIRKIDNILPIENADLIECAVLGGWNVVVKKGEFKPGDLVVYFEIDSFLPINPLWDFLEKDGVKTLANGDKGLRLKSKKLRGVVSQGLVMPMRILCNKNHEIIVEDCTIGCYNDLRLNEEVIVNDKKSVSFLIEKYDGIVLNIPAKIITSLEEGTDVTDLLGVQKYEAPIPANLAGVAKGNFPNFFKRTDEERIQNLGWEGFYECYKDELFYIGEKLDGTSLSCYLKDDTFGVCSRNLDLVRVETNTYWKNALHLEELVRQFYTDFGVEIALQGELVGEGIQDNNYKLIGHHIKFFNIWNINAQRYFDYQEFVDTIRGYFGLETVPIVDDAFKLLPDIQDMIKLADGKSLLNPKSSREGLVIRQLCQKQGKFDNYSPDRVSFKVISNKYLLKNDG